MEKMTKKQKFEILKGLVADNSMLVEFIDNEIDLLNKKSKSGSLSKTQKENVAYKEQIVQVLANATSPMSATDIGNSIPMGDGKMSNQKASALLKQLVEDNKVERVDIGKSKVGFKLM